MKICCFCLFLGLVGLGLPLRAQEAASADLPRSTPEKQGISSVAIRAFVEAADQQIDAIHSYMLVRHGKVIAEGWWAPCAPELPHTMFSLSKSFTSTAVGLAIAEGKLSLDDPVVGFFPEDAPTEPSAALKAMRVRDLLIMSSGQASNVVSSFKFDTNIPLTREFLGLPVENKPGTFWFYNTPGSYMLSAIVQKVTGQTVLDYLKPRILDPLGITDASWETSPQGVSLGGYGLHIKTEDIAKFGLLYLDKGKWHGRQLIPAAWVEEATKKQSSNGSNPRSDWEQGYGYRFWRCRHGLYRGDGAYGQFCIVFPEQDAVLAMTAGTTNTATMMNLVWDLLLPAFQKKALYSDKQNLAELRKTEAGLTLHPAQGSASPAPVAMSGKRFHFPENDLKAEAVSLDFSKADAAPTLNLRYDGQEQHIACPKNSWNKGRLNFVSDGNNPPSEQAVAASGAWTAPGVFTVKLAFYETPFSATLTLRFDNDKLNYGVVYNCTRGKTSHIPELTGTAE